ncbi:MAG: proline--tRNA ligase [Oligoflexia bacterium]|nr:proline--tRNA ligase [Oligoflexia bacterium]MBF0364458.1 proline--tRNA ligase [Oligoflexia bacterium]
MSKEKEKEKGSKAVATAISPTRTEDYPEWYQQVVKAADLAELSPARGCMVIKPWGYGIWENIQKILDKRFKETGHQNAYFPLFIPKSFLEKEAEHVEGFAKECAVVTHHRLEKGPDGGLVPAGPLSEPYIVRPTSETIIGAMFAKWIRSYRDLPLLINQWANVVRWEMRTRLFLRTTEFLWQEGHTVHATAEDAREETLRMLDVYTDFCEGSLAIPIVRGEKTESERFPGAVNTYSIEPMMQDRKALQGGTSHFLGQNFAKASEIKYLDQAGAEQFAWTTSWGVSTRLIGALVMSHADDNGLILPPRVAPTHIIIMPMVHKVGTEEKVMEYCNSLANELRAKIYAGREVEVHIDRRDLRGGEKMWSWIKKGAPICMEIGPRDVDAGAVFFYRRDQEPGKKANMPRAEFVAKVGEILEDIQGALFRRANNFMMENTRLIDCKEEFYAFFTPKNAEKPEIHGGYALTHWSGESSVEAKIKEDLNVTIRCIPFVDERSPIRALLEGDRAPAVCPFTGKASRGRVLFAKAY